MARSQQVGEDPNDQLPAGGATGQQPFGISSPEQQPPDDLNAGRGTYRGPDGVEHSLTPLYGVRQDELYMPGDEWAPANDPDSIINIQQQMIQAGLLDPKDVRPGVWDTTCATAYRQVLALANATASTDKTALRWLASHPTLGSQEDQGDGRVYSITNPEDTKAAYANAALSLTGKGGGEADQFTSAYQQQERDAIAANENAIKEGGGTTTSAPSLGTAAETYVKEKDPASVIAYGAASRMMEFYNMLDSATGL